MAKQKTLPTNSNVADYIASIEDPKKRTAAEKLIIIMQTSTGEKPVMWGSSIVGFGSYHYKYASGHEGDSLKVGFSARKSALVIYGLIIDDASTKDGTSLLSQLGNIKTGKGCIYVTDFNQINETVLIAMIKNSFNHTP